MKALLCFPPFWGLFFHCCGEPGSQKQWLNSVITPLSTSNIPWLVSIDETCQGIILNQWWVLSTARCLTKLKHLQYDISGFNDQENNFFGNKICLYPSFDPQMGTDSVKEDIGMVLLQYPLKRKMSLSHTYNFFRKSCYNCHPRHCRIYKYQNQHSFPTRIKKLAVKILDLSFCHHKQVHLSTSNNLCIQIQPQEDCSVQWGSPLLCHFGSHWKLIGLISESSVTCYDPILVIKTTPYLSWMRWIIKTSQKPLKPAFFLPCTVSTQVEHSTQDKLSMNKDSAIFFSNGSSVKSWRLNTFSLNRKRRNSPVIFGSDIKDYFPDNRQLYVQSSQLHSVIKFPVVQSQIHSKFPLYGQLSSRPWLKFISHVVPWTYSKADKTVMQIQPNEKSIRTQVHLLDDRITDIEPVTYTMHPRAPAMVNKLGFWTHSALLADVSHYPTVIHTLEPWFQPMLNVVGSQKVLDRTSGYLNVPQYMATQLQTSSAIFMPFTWPLSVDTTLNPPKMESCPYCKSIITKHSSQMQIINTKIKHEFNILKTPQIQTEDKIRFLVNTISNILLPFSHTEFDFMRSWAPPEAELVKTWTSNPAGRPLTQRKDDIILPWFHPRIKRLRSWIQPKFQINRPMIQTEEIKDYYWTQPETYKMKPWTYNDMERIRHWSQLENIGRTWLLTKYDHMKPMTQTYLKTLHLWTQPDANTWRLPEIKVQSWPKPDASMLRPRTIFKMDVVRQLLQTQTDTVRTYNQPDFQTIFSLYDLEADRISPWLNTQMEAFKSCLETKIQTHSWPQPEGDITRLQPQFADDNVKLWFQNQIQTVSLLTETVTQTAYHWSQSETEIGRPWNQPIIDRDNWIHEAYKVGPWDEFEGEKSRFWIQPEADTMRPWMQLENGIINPWTQSESNTIISYTQDESSEEKFWTHSGNETIIPLTQMLAETVPTWTMAEFLGLNPQVYSVSDTFRLWTQTDSIAKNIWAQPVTQGEPSEIDLWTKNIVNTATTWTQDESLITNTWTQSENDTVIPWIHPESLGINLWSQPIADVVTEWVQSEPSEIVFWTKVVSNRVIPMTQTEYLTANPWAQSEMDTTTLLTQAEFITINPLLNRVAGSITQWSHFESISVTSCVQTRADTITLCIQSESPLYSWAIYETNLVTTCTLAESLFFRPFETVSISTWTKKINPEINPWVQSETAVTTTWIQGETSGIKSWIQHTIDMVAIETQTESVERNPWTEAEYVSVTAVTQLALLANSWTESIAPMVIPWTRDTSSPTDLWLQSTIDLDILWTKTSYPGLNPWTDNIFQTRTDTSATNHWSKTFISSEQAEFSSVEIRGYPVSGQFTPLTQAESLTIDLWTESADLSAIFCPPPLIISCTVAAISKVTPMTQTESSPVINWSECTNSTVTLCTPCGTQIGKTSIAIVPGTLTLLDISAIMSVNLWSYSMTETFTQWFQNESPVYTLEQSVSDYFRMLTQTIIVPVNPLTKPKAFAFTPRNKAESLEENMWTKFSSETISLETVKLYPVENHLIETMKIWTYSETGTVTFGIQAESPIAKTWTQSMATTQWTDSKSLSINMWTQPQFYAANPWIQYELPTVNVLTEFRSLAPTPSVQTEFSTDIPYTQSVSPSRISWTSSVTTTVILWTWIESLALNSWTISETDRGIHISSDDSLSLSFLKKCENDMGKMLPQIKSSVSLVTQNVVNKIRVWNHVEYLTSNYFPKTVTDTDRILDGSPTLSWTEDLTSVVTFWTDTKTNIENLWSLSNFEIETQIQSAIISPNEQSENSVSVRTLAESPAVNPGKQPIATTVTILTLTLSACSQSVVSPVTSGAQAELSTLTQWSTSVASIIKPWTHTELKAINAHLGSLVTAISTLPQADYVRVNPWPQSIASTVKYLTTTEYPSVSLWLETVFFTFRQWIMTESSTIKTWTKPIFSTANPWIQDEFPMLTLWTTAITSTGESKFCAESPRENTCLETLVSLVTQWTHAEYSTANADTQAISSTVRSWDMVETQTLNFWTEMIASTVTPWTQTEYLRMNSWTEAIDTISEAWNKDEYSTMKFWTQTLPFTVTLDTQIESLSNPSPDTVVSTTILPWDRAESLKKNIFITALMFKDTLWTHTLSSGINIWTKTLITTLFQGTQTLSLGYPLTLTTDDTLISRTLAEYVTVSSYLPTVMDRVLFWTVFKTESQKTLLLPEASIFDISLHSQSDTAVPLMKVKTQMSHPWTHQEIDNTWTLPISGKSLSWNIPLLQETEMFPEPEIYTGLYRFKTQTEIMLPGAQSEFQMISTLTQLGSWREQSMFQIQTISWNLTETSLFLPGNNSIRDTVQYWIFSEADKLGPWVQTKADMANTWTHSSSYLIRSCTQVELEAAKLCTESEINTAILLTQTEVYAVKQFSIYDSFMERPFFQPQIEEKRQSTKTESHIVTMWIQQTAQITQTKFQSETEIIELFAESESQVDTTQTEAGRFYIPSLTDTIITWTQLQTQLTYSWSQNEVSIINSWTHYENSLIRSWTKIQTDITKPWISVGDSTIKPWAQLITLEDHPSIQTEANTIVRHWLPTQVISVNHWIPLDALHSSPTLSETGVPPCLQTQSYITTPCIQPGLTPVQFVDPQKLVHLIQTETSVNPSSSHPQINSGTDNPWIYPETQAAKPWTTVEANTYESWFRIQMTKFRPWTESQVFNAWTQANVDVIRSWIPADILAIMRTRLHSEDDISSFVTTQPNNVRMINLPETEIKHDTYFKTVTITSFASAVEPGGATSLLTSNFSSWSKYLPFLPVENILYSDQYFTTLSTEISALGCEDKINCLYPSKLTDISLFTPENTSFPFADGAQNFDNKLQVTETIDNSLSPSSCLSPHTPSFYLLIPCTSPYSNALSSSCSVFCPCTLISLFPSCSSFPPVSASSPIFLPLASCSNSLQAPSSSKLTMESIISPICSTLQASTTTISTKQTPMMPGSHSGTSTNQPEQNPPSYLELNVSLAECHLGVVWKESLQAFWLFKTAVISHETTECGLRPGLIPHCPNCWEAEIGEFPWMVSIQLSFSHFCAGSILNERWILTTARCANFIKNSEALALVQVGLNDLQDPSQAQSVGIHRVMPYLGPKGPLGPGLIFLKQSLHFQSLVLPICLEETLEQEKNIQLYDCWLPSWSLMRGSPGILQKRHLSILQVINCAQFWPKLNEFTFCVEAKKAMGEAGCKGDLGAPLVCHLQQKDTWVQVGILTHFDEHCTKPYVFSQVSPFIFWLQGVTQPSHAPWSQQVSVTNSPSIYNPVSTSKNASAYTSTPAYIRPHFISLPQPQILADRISLRYAMPWQAMIISCGNQICSGSIVSSSWVLTAAHCVRNMNPEDTAVILGLRHPGAPLRVVKVSSILLHERFRLVSGAARNDLALLLLQEIQSPVQLLAPLGNLKNLNSSECWLSGPRILKPGDTDENPEMLQIQVMGASSCAHLYPDIGSSIVCFITQAKASDINLEPVSPGSAVMCRPVSGNGSWRQIGLTSLKALATVVSPHFSWILSASEKAGHPLNQAVMPWVEKPKSSSLPKQPTAMPVFTIIIFIIQSFL